jgi:hypothetical protein
MNNGARGADDIVWMECARVQLHRHLGALAAALWAPACLKKHSFAWKTQSGWLPLSALINKFVITDCGSQ